MTKGVSLPLFLAMCGCGGMERAPGPSTNVVMVVVDTLRQDHVGCYGAQRDTSPAIDRLAAEGVRFERAYSTAPWTMPSIATMLTGLYPSRHSATSFDRALPGQVDTLAEVLKRHGYGTAGVISHTAISSKHGFQQGFDVWHESEAQGHDYVSTPGVTRQAIGELERLAGKDEPFFLFVHYFDPHFNYKRHAEVGFAPPKAGRLDGTELMRAIRDLQDSLTPEELEFVTALYDEEIRYTDGGIGSLLGRLDALGLRENTLVVLTADHGEEFLDHGRLGHTHTLYEELVRVPLIFRLPAGAGGKVVPDPVSLVALMPTILDLVGASEPELPQQGRSLRPYLTGAPFEDPQPVFTEVDFIPVRVTRTLGPVHKKAVVAGRYKLLRDDPSGAFELYDVVADPAETRDLYAAAPAGSEGLGEALDRSVAFAASAAIEPERVTQTEEQIHALKDLGYIGD